MKKLNKDTVSALSITYGWLLAMGAPPEVIMPVESIIIPQYVVKNIEPQPHGDVK